MVALDRLPTPAEMVRHLDVHVAGQERAKRDLAAAVYRHYLGLAARDTGDADFGPQHALLVGPTGCGKTLLVRTLAEYLGVPVAFCAATSLVETGYVGDQVESVLVTLARAAGDVTKAQRGIVFLDEFDKVRRAHDVGRDVSGEGVQNALLSLLDGTRTRFRFRDSEVALDSSRVLFVCAGAFAGLADLVRRRLAHRGGIGFGARVRETHVLPEAEALTKLLPEDLVAYGFVPELVGRFPNIAAVRPLGRDDLVHVLGGVSGSVLGRWNRQFELHGVQLLLDEGARDALADRALSLGTGARALPRLVGEALEPVAWRLPDLAAEGVRAVRVDAGVVAGAREPELLHALADDTAADDDPFAVTFPRAEHLRRVAMAGAEAVGESPDSIMQRTPTQVAATIERLKLQLRMQLLQGERLLAWVDFERERDPRIVLWALESLQQRGLSMARFADALRETRSPHLPAVLHYAAYLEERARHEAKERKRRPKRDDDAPQLEL